MESKQPFATNWRELAEEAAAYIETNVGLFDHLVDYEGKTKLLEKIEAAGRTIPSETPRSEPTAWAIFASDTHEMIDLSLIDPDEAPGQYVEPLFARSAIRQKPAEVEIAGPDAVVISEGMDDRALVERHSSCPVGTKLYKASRVAEGLLEAALDLLEMCNSCDLIYSVSHATGVYKDGKEDERRVADLVRAFVKEHGRE